MDANHHSTDAQSCRSTWGAPRVNGQLAVLLAVLFLASATAFATGSKDGGACTRTARAAFTACQHDVQDNYWLANANCENLPDVQARAACKREADSTLKEGTATCGEQREARLEVCRALGETPYDPKIDPTLFVDPADIGRSVNPHPYFPLVRGSVRVYKGGSESITVTVTSETRTILGVRCAVVRDVVKENGTLIEDTKDYFAQDIYGNVWYFGEISLNYEGGELVDIDGSWTAGRDGAKAGLIMKAHPALGDVYRQEFSLGNAEDVAEVLSLRGSARVPATSASCSGNCLITKESTPLEPGAIEHKYYARGVGPILIVKPDTGARVELVEFR
jgi:hypothetical protein